MKFADYVLLTVIAVGFIGALVYTIRRRKSGGCCGSGSGSSPNGGINSCGGCSGCSSRSGCSGCSSFIPVENDDSSGRFNSRTDK